MSLAMSTQLHQHQLNLIRQTEKYNQGIAEYNLNKVIRSYKDAINSAETSQEARNFAQALESILSNNGKSLSDVKGLNTDLLNATTANANMAKANAAGNTAKADTKQKGSTYDKEIIKDLSEEFGIDVKKSGTTKDWLEKAKQDQNVRILDESGKDITAEREGRIKKGDILEVNSKKHGLVKISVGGDGEINGNDDKVLSVGGKAAANSMVNGLNQINNVPNQAGQEIAANQTNPLTTANPFAQAMIDPEKAAQMNAYNGNAMQSLFNEDQIKNLIAAILQQSLYSIDNKEYERYLNNFNVA